jgi:hypothetical protein
MKLYMFRTIPLSIIRRFSPYTQQWYMSHKFCRQLSGRIGMEHPDPARKLSTKPLSHIPLLCVRWEITDDGKKNCPKHVEFHFKVTFEKFSASSWFYYKDNLVSSSHRCSLDFSCPLVDSDKSFLVYGQFSHY